ncbi:MAG: lysine--tRNA ligase [Candidatus Dojkabacteria bacterium]|nr:MAG: lysine--tRNA ligase [Candidatus Dojkabacteria bacterium]
MNETKFGSDLIGQRAQRIAKVKELTQLGINPYPGKGERTKYASEIIVQYAQLEGKKVVVNGRVMTWRQHGDIQFIDLQDQTGRIQLYIRNEELGATNTAEGILGLDKLHLLDIGDHIEARGTVTKTKTGQESVLVTSIKLLSKSIRPLPNKWQGVTDKETRYRRRYLDMTMNPEVREMFVRRGVFWNAVRDFMESTGFTEVNIPVLEHTTGGADARPFETYYDALAENFYLRISHELPLKRLLGGGFEKVYDLGPRFRNEGFSEEHLPEHVAMEWYWAYADSRDGMKLTEEMFKYVLEKVYGTLQFEIRGNAVDLSGQWEEIDFSTVVWDKFGVSVFDDTVEKLVDVYVKNGGEADLNMNRSRVADGLWKLIRKDIVGPVFLTGVPKFLSPLSKANVDDPRKADRFHPIILGSEMANAFSELNDPQEQLDRFLEQQDMRDSGDEEAHMLDIDFVEMLEYGMPPAVGFGMSERVFWAFEAVTAREGVPFPPMKRFFDNFSKEIYGDRVDFSKLTSHKKPAYAASSTPASNSKFVIVLNKDVEGWRLTNTVGHLTAYLGGKVGEAVVGRESFTLADGDKISANSQFPVITLAANPGQMVNFARKVQETGLPYLIYVDEMIQFNLDDPLQEDLKDKKLDDLLIWGIGVFGAADIIDPLTKKFSMWG